jgi:hypothetical protein
VVSPFVIISDIGAVKRSQLTELYVLIGICPASRPEFVPGIESRFSSIAYSLLVKNLLLSCGSVNEVYIV